MATDVRLLSGQQLSIALGAAGVDKEVARRTVQVERSAKQFCPVDTGRLRSSITSRVGRDSQGSVGVVGTSVEYGVYVELGTSRMSAQPYLRPALAVNP